MRPNTSQSRNRAFVVAGLGTALLVAVILSPFASPDPDGLNRVAEDHNFADKEVAEPPAQKLPFSGIFDGYALKGVPEGIATPIAGFIGTLAVFGLAWGLGKVAVRNSGSSDRDSYTGHSD